MAAPTPNQLELLAAARIGNVAEVTRLLTLGTSPNFASLNDCSPLYLAVGIGHLEVARALLAAGAQVDFAGREDTSPLHEAINHYNVDMAILLIESGANLDFLDGNNYDPLMRARSNNGTEFVPIIKNYKLLHAASSGNYENFIDMLRKGADINATNTKKQTALHLAIANGHTDLARIIIAGVNPANNRG